jgi:4'-phosphopantetheinyl transferase
MNTQTNAAVLRDRELHLWWIDTSRPAEPLEALKRYLDPDERRRAERFVREADRRKFVVSHAALRIILGQYLGVPPDQVETAAGPGGKPQLIASSPLPLLRFNLSHSEERALVGVAYDQEVGVDVEHVRPLTDAAHLVARCFSAGEQSAWQSLPLNERLPAFFRCWTRKEAYLKARGVGLSAGLDHFEVSLAPGEPARILSINDSTTSPAQWPIGDVPGDEGYMAAYVVEGKIDRYLAYDATGQLIANSRK